MGHILPQLSATLSSLLTTYRAKLAAHAVKAPASSTSTPREGMTVTVLKAKVEGPVDDGSDLYPEHLEPAAALAGCGNGELVRGKFSASRRVPNQGSIRVPKRALQAAVPGVTLYDELDGDGEVMISGALHVNRAFHDDDVVVEVRALRCSIST